MTTPDSERDAQWQAALAAVAADGVNNAVRGFSGMLGRPFTVTVPQVRWVSYSELMQLIGEPEGEAVGIYLRSLGEIAGQILLVLEYTKALELVDFMMEVPRGTTHELRSLEKSALAELGNLTGSLFLNALAATTGIGSRPTPPSVIVDMLGTMLDIVVTMYTDIGQDVLLLQAEFIGPERETQANFWVIPDPEAVRVLAQKMSSHANDSDTPSA